MSDTPDNEAVDQEAVAAAWAAEAGAETDEDESDEALAAAWEAAEGGADKVLDQSEIDNLLGVGVGGGGDEGEKSGISAILNRRDVTYERLPMLEVIFDRLERMLTSSVRQFTSENIDVSLENISAQRFGDYLNSVPLPAMIGVFRAVEWDNFGLVTIDSPLIYSIVDVLLGNRRAVAPMRVEGRPYTTIETSLIERLTRLMLADLTAAFAPISPVEFRLERTETNPRFAAISQSNNACVVFKMRVDMEGRGGCFDFIIPYATLEPVRDLLLQGFMGEKFGRDPIWETHLAREIWSSDVDLEAVLAEVVMPLSQATRLEVGSVLRLGTPPDSPVALRCGSVPLLKGHIGQIGAKIAIEIDEPIQRNGGDSHD